MKLRFLMTEKSIKKEDFLRGLSLIPIQKQLEQCRTYTQIPMEMSMQLHISI